MIGPVNTGLLFVGDIFHFYSNFNSPFSKQTLSCFDFRFSFSDTRILAESWNPILTFELELDIEFWHSNSILTFELGTNI